MVRRASTWAGGLLAIQAEVVSRLGSIQALDGPNFGDDLIFPGLTIEELLLGIGMPSALAVGLIVTRTTARHGTVSAPILTLVCFCIIAPFTFAQLVIAPKLLPLLMRNSAGVCLSEPWRLLTSLLVQDGGWVGAAFNLLGLLAIGSVAEHVLGRRQWGVVATLSILCAQISALLWQPAGAGNSILNFGLAGALCAVGLMGWRYRQLLVPAIGALACFVFLLMRRDIHGVAAITGAIVACAFSLGGRRDSDGTAP